jgi:phosphate:Na+ symporter
MYKRISLFLSFILLSSQFLFGEENSSVDLSIDKALDPIGNDISGDKQIGVVTTVLEKPFLVRVTNKEGNPVKGVAVEFSVLNDREAECSPSIAFTDNSGYAKVLVTAGKNPGQFILEAKLYRDPKKREILSYHIFSRRWIYLLIIQLIGGFGLFFFGFKTAGKGLTKAAGGSLREVLYRFTKNRFLGVLSGAVISVLLQSSTATSVMLVSFVTAGLVSIVTALSVSLGSAIGTTITVQLIAFKIYNYSLLIIGIGFFLNSFRKPLRYYGQFILGFGLVFLGIKFMGEAFLPLSLSGSLEQFFVAFREHPCLVFFVSALFTSLVNSSAATIGIIVSLSFQGIISLEHALPVIIGANIGNGVAALVASLRGSRKAKVYSVSNFLFKIITVFVFLPLVGFWGTLIQRTATGAVRQIANSHTFFNIVFACISFPLIGLMVRVVNKIIPRERREMRKGPRFLDKTILDNPAAAIAHAHREVLRMADLVLDMFTRSILVFKKSDKDTMRELIAKDDEIDILEREINDYLTDISQEELTTYQSRRVASLFFITDEIEHIGDIVSKSLMVYAGKKIKKGFLFSDEGFHEIIAFHRKVQESFELSISALTTYDKKLAERVREERKKGVEEHVKLHSAHIERLKKGLQESIETSTVHLDLINDLERVNFHVSNIGLAILGRINER